MALKGTTKIELTNVKTGEVEILQETNMVTNAISDILNTDPFNLRWDGNVLFRNNLLPIIGNIVGGIVLFENKLGEDPAKYYAPASNPIIGYSNMEVSPETDVKRGSMNQTESGPLEDGTGYRFVFDFANTQGNGKISAVSLCSPFMGACGYGSEEYIDHVKSADSSETVKNKYSFPLCGSHSYTSSGYIGCLSSCITTLDIENNIAYAVICEAKNSVSIYKIGLTTNKFGLMSKYELDGYELITTLTTQNFRSTTNTTTTTQNYYTFVDGDDGYIWGFETGNNASSSSTVKWIKIDKTSWEFTEGTWTLPRAVLTGFISGKLGTQSTFYCRCQALVKDGYAYFWGSDSKSVVIINTSNPTDITEIVSDKSLAPYTTTDKMSYFTVMGDVVYMPCGRIIDKALQPTKVSQSQYYPNGVNNIAKPNVRVGPVLLGFTGTSSTVGVRMLLDNSYLATINNLQNPVQKTADKTMKITYILREES